MKFEKQSTPFKLITQSFVIVFFFSLFLCYKSVARLWVGSLLSIKRLWHRYIIIYHLGGSLIGSLKLVDIGIFLAFSMSTLGKHFNIYFAFTTITTTSTTLFWVVRYYWFLADYSDLFSKNISFCSKTFLVVLND